MIDHVKLFYTVSAQPLNLNSLKNYQGTKPLHEVLFNEIKEVGCNMNDLKLEC